MVTLAQYRQQYGGGGMGGEVAKGVSDILQALLMYQLTQQKQEREDDQTRYDRATEQKAFAYGQAQATIEHARSEMARIRTEHEQSVQGAFAAHGTRVAQDEMDARRDVLVPFRNRAGGDMAVAYTLYNPEALGQALYETNAELFQRIEALQEVTQDPLLIQAFNDAGLDPDLLAGVVDREAKSVMESAQGVYSMLMHSSEQGAKAAGAMRDRQIAGVAMPTSEFQRQQSIVMGRYMPEMAETTKNFRGLDALVRLTADNEAEAADLKRIAALTASPEDDAMVDKILKSHSDKKSGLKGKHIANDSAMYAELEMGETASEIEYYSRYRQAVQKLMAGDIKAEKYRLIARSFDANGRANQVDTFTGGLGGNKARRWAYKAGKQDKEVALVATLNDGDYRFELEIPPGAALLNSPNSKHFDSGVQYHVRSKWKEFVEPVSTHPLNADRVNKAAFEAFKGNSLYTPIEEYSYRPVPSRVEDAVDPDSISRTGMAGPVDEWDVDGWSGDPLDSPDARLPDEYYEWEPKKQGGSKRTVAEGIAMPGDKASPDMPPEMQPVVNVPPTFPLGMLPYEAPELPSEMNVPWGMNFPVDMTPYEGPELPPQMRPAVRDAPDSEPVLDFLERAGTRALVELLPRVLGKVAGDLLEAPADPGMTMPSAFAGFPAEAPGLPPIDIPSDVFTNFANEAQELLPGPDAAAYPDMPPAFPLDMPPTPDLLLSPEMKAQNEQLDRLRFLMSEEAATMFAAGEERERQRQAAMQNYLLLQDLANDINQEQERQRLGAMQNYELLKGWLGDKNEYETNVRDADMPSAYPLQEGILRDRGTENLELLQDIIRLGKKQTKQKASDPDRRGGDAVRSLLELSREAKELEEYNERMQRMYGSRNK